MAAGRIYRRIADNYLSRYYPCMDKEERDSLLNGSVNEIEKLVGIKGFIEVGVLAIWNNALPSDIMTTILFDLKPEVVLAEARKAYLEAYPSEEERAKMALKAVKAIHDLWVGSSANLFFSEDRQDKRYMFMPTWLIGFEEMLKDYELIQPFLDELGVEPSLDTLREVYLAEQRKFLQWECIYDHEGLKRYIADIKYTALTFGIFIKLKSEPKLVAKIAEQVEKRNKLYD